MHPPKEDRIDVLFGEIVAQHRADLGLTQRQVEKAAGLGTGSMSRIETGRRKTILRPQEYKRLAAALEFSPATGLEAAGYLPEMEWGLSRSYLPEMDWDARREETATQ